MWRRPSTGSGVLGGGTDCFSFSVFLLQNPAVFCQDKIGRRIEGEVHLQFPLSDAQVAEKLT